MDEVRQKVEPPKTEKGLVQFTGYASYHILFLAFFENMIQSEER
jgi:hypothetical protein